MFPQFVPYNEAGRSAKELLFAKRYFPTWVFNNCDISL